ncbi:MAG: hypothetical protein ACREPB_04925 [Arenimonas sp.]
MNLLLQIIIDQFRFLFFRQPGKQIATHWQAYLVFGFFCTWLAGIGRYWDNPRAHLFQHLGLGSVVYVLFLSALLWILFYPLKPKHWLFRNVLVFVSLCSLPALLYAIPVERLLPLETAQSANAWFLAIVASWRVALLVVFLKRVAQLPGTTVLVATLLPIALIIVALSALNLEHVVFNIMAGNGVETSSPNDLSYGIVFLLSIFSTLALPVLAIAYAVLVYQARRAAE